MSGKGEAPLPADQWTAYSAEKEKHNEMTVGEHYCLIYASWLKAWQSYAKDGIPKAPGEIDNTRLLESDRDPKSPIKEGLLEGQDYELVHESLWQMLHGWFGGGPTITRTVIAEGETFKRVEVYLMSLKLLHTNKDGLPVPASEYTLTLSKSSSLDILKKMFKLDESKVRLWNMFSGAPELLAEGTKSLDDLRLVPAQRVLFEVQLADATWPRANKTEEKKKAGLFSRVFGSGSGASDKHDDHRSSEHYSRGLCGLQNLGNTCFMNAALQCLSNTAPLNEFFLTGAYKAKVNSKNPLGMKGELAEHFGSLMRELWSGKYSSVAPKDLKWKIGKLNPVFSGYNQHDSQELLAFLLDGLHEDLNQITKKPYVEITDSNGRPDSVVADEHWSAHRRRNESFIVDTFQGQLKSTITCPKCPKISITFDPFMYLSLPLPVNTTRSIEVVFMKADRSDLGRRYSARLEKTGYVSDLLASLATLTNISADRLEVCDVFNQRIYETLAPSRPLSAIKSQDVIFAYEVPSTVDLKSKNTIRVEVLHRSGSNLFSYPFTLYFTSESTGKDMWHTVWRAAKRYVVPLDLKAKGEVNVENFEVERMPFKLLIGSQTGMHCGVCSSLTSNCKGCEIKYKDKSPEFKRNDITFVLHFPGESKSSNYLPDKAESVYKDPSVDKNRAHDKSGPQLSLIDCLKCFTVKEKLGPKDEWFCPSCKEHVQAFKRLELWKVPNVLVIHLKRFQAGSWGFREKLNSFVDFPLTEFDLSEYVLDSRQEKGSLAYDLFAVSNHMGGMGGGHYTAYAKNKDDNSWHYFNDSSCSGVKSTADIRSEAAYVLFYQRRQSAPSSSPATPVSSPSSP